MKILYLANARIPTEKANGKQIIKTCEALSAIGHEVELWIPKRKQTEKLKDTTPFDFYQVSQIFKIRQFPTIDLFPYTDRLPNAVNLVVYFLQELSFVLAIILFGRKDLRGKIVYTRCLSVAVAIKLLFQGKVYYEAHNIGVNSVTKHLYYFFVSLLDGLVVISDGLKKAFIAGGISKITVIPGSVDIKEISVMNRAARRKKLGFENKKSIVYTGRLTAPKGVYTLVKAAKKILAKQKNTVFYLVGDSTQNDLQNLTKLAGNPDQIKFVGPVTPHESLVYQRAADVLVLPGSAQFTNPREYTSPLKLFEYLASGVPMIATSVPANTAILTHKINAYLIPPDEPYSLARGITTVLNDKKLARSLAHQAKKDAGNYTWEKRAEKIIKFISS